MPRTNHSAIRYPNHFAGPDCPCDKCKAWRDRHPLEYAKLKGDSEALAKQTTYDKDIARQERDHAVAQVDENAPERFKRLADEVVHEVAASHTEFIVDLPRRIFHERYPEHEPVEQRAWGPVMMRAKAAGWIAPTDRLQNSEQVKSHHQPRRVWRSLLKEDEYVG